MEYKRWETGEGTTLRERKKTRVICTTCGVKVAVSYLKSHTTRSHVICAPQTRGVDEVGGGGATTYVVSFSRVLE